MESPLVAVIFDFLHLLTWLILIYGGSSFGYQLGSEKLGKFNFYSSPLASHFYVFWLHFCN